MRYNQLTTLPPEIGNLFQNVYVNFIDTFSLVLQLNDNQLTTLPPEIGQLPFEFSSLYISNNQITTLPSEIYKLSLRRFYADNNMLCFFSDSTKLWLRTIPEYNIKNQNCPDDIVIEPECPQTADAMKIKYNSTMNSVSIIFGNSRLRNVVYLFSVNGSLLQKKSGYSRIFFDLDGLSQGVYTIKIVMGKKIVIKKSVRYY